MSLDTACAPFLVRPEDYSIFLYGRDLLDQSESTVQSTVARDPSELICYMMITINHKYDGVEGPWRPKESEKSRPGCCYPKIGSSNWNSGREVGRDQTLHVTPVTGLGKAWSTLYF